MSTCPHHVSSPSYPLLSVRHLEGKCLGGGVDEDVVVKVGLKVEGERFGLAERGLGGPSRERWMCPPARQVEHSGHVHRQGGDHGDLATKEEKRKLAKKKTKEKMRKQTRKPICTRAWGRGIDRVGRSYPDPYLAG